MDEQRRHRTPDTGHPIGSTTTVSAREAAAALGLNERTIRRAITRGDLSAAKEAGVFRITLADLDKYREFHRLPTAMPVPTVSPLPRLIPVPRRLHDARVDLPSPLTDLIGRDREMEAAGSLLQRDGVRLITLTGPGGVGKTRLAIQIAGAFTGRFATGVRFVPLATVPNASLVGTSIAAILGLRERGDHSIRDTLVSALRESEALLVLDNFEHVMAATTLVTDLLEQCPKLRILVTSRTLLRVAGEHALPVPPLALPDQTTTHSPERLAEVAAPQLFTERAQAVVPEFALSESTAPLVAEICQLLDGLPLAIELAAARLTHVPLLTLRERLAPRLPLLSRGGGSSERHHTLRNAIAWSYGLLSPNEQTFFRRLAVFAGGFTLDAAEAVTRDVDGSASAAALDSLGTLIDASLLRQETGPDGRARYRMLETIREFAGEQFAESDEEAVVRRAHATHFLAFAKRYELAELLPNGDEAVARLEAERPNLRSALTWFEEAGETGQLLRLATALGRYWYGQGHFQEGRDWLQRALSQRGELPAEDTARAYTLLGIIDEYLGAFRDAEANLTEGLTLCRAVGDTIHSTYALIFLGGLCSVQGDHDQAAIFLAEALDTARDVTDRRLSKILTAITLVNLAVLDRSLSNQESAKTRLKTSLQLHGEVGYNSGTILVLSDLGDIARDEGDVAQASTYFQDALNQIRESTDTRVIIDTIESVATVAAAVGLADRCARLLGAGDALRDQTGYRFRGEHHQDAYDRAVVTARAILGEPAFANAWAAGRALRVDRAVAEALAPMPTPVVAPAIPLTPREAEILPLVAAGHTDREIGAVLYLSHRTVGNHVARIMEKLGKRTRAAAVESARAKGLLHPAPPDHGQTGIADQVLETAK